MSNIEPEDDSNSEDDWILSACIAIVKPTEGIVEDVDEEKELVESKFEKMDNQDDIRIAYAKLYKVLEKHEKMYRLASKKLSDVEVEWEELSIKFEEAIQTIWALRFKNNFLAERTKKLEAELFQVRAQLERTSSAKLDEMLSLQKSASDQTGLGYVRTYVFHMLRTYVMILCNWLILWQNTLYLYLARLRMCLNTSRNYVSRSSVEAFKSIQEIKQKVKIH